MAEVPILPDQLTITKASKAEPSFCMVSLLGLIYGLDWILV